METLGVQCCNTAFIKANLLSNISENLAYQTYNEYNLCSNPKLYVSASYLNI